MDLSSEIATIELHSAPADLPAGAFLLPRFLAEPPLWGRNAAYDSGMLKIGPQNQSQKLSEMILTLGTNNLYMMIEDQQMIQTVWYPVA